MKKAIAMFVMALFLVSVASADVAKAPAKEGMLTKVKNKIMRHKKVAKKTEVPAATTPAPAAPEKK